MIVTEQDPPRRDYEQAALKVMKQQAALGLRVASVFIVLIVGLPLCNMYFPKAAGMPVFGFTLTWLFLGVAFFPITWLLSAYFVRESNRIESDAARSALGSADPAAAPIETISPAVQGHGNE